MKVVLQVALISSLFLFCGIAKADVVINLVEVNGDIQIEGTGTIDLDSTLGFFGVELLGHSFNARNDPGLFVGVFPFPADQYSLNGVVGTGDFSSSSLVTNIGGNESQGIFVNDFTSSSLFVPVGYQSGDPLDFTAFISNTTFADLGFQVGDQTVATWSNQNVTESLTLNWTGVPEPSSTVFLGIYLVGSWLQRRR